MVQKVTGTARAILTAAGVVAAGAAAGMLLDTGRAVAGDRSGLLAFRDATGVVQTIDTNGPIDLDNPFFQDLGTNGRRCVTCHQPGVGWTITPANVQERFQESRGTDPIFTNNDGSNCEGVVTHSIAEKKAAYELLLTRGLIRVGLDVPNEAEFYIESVSDPNHCRFA